MITTIQELPGKTIEFTITIPWDIVKKKYDVIFSHLLSEVEVAGFRKGKAPREMAEKQIDKTKVYEEVIKELVPQVYADTVQKNNKRPIISPKVELIEAEEGKDWKIKATTCEKPDIKLGNYREKISKLKAAKQQKIWVPGQEKPKDEKAEEPTLAEILDALSEIIEISLSPILLDQEVNRMLSNLINETQKLGLTVDQYLQAQGKTSDSIRKEYEEQATKNLKLEFGLEEIADKEKITIDDSDIDAVINNTKNEEQKKSLSGQRYYIASILRRQKTITELVKSPLIKA